MKRTIKLNENILKALIAEAIFENIGGYRDNYNDFPSAVADFVQAYKQEGPDGPNTTKFYHEIVATFRLEGCKHIKYVALRDAHLKNSLGKLSVEENISEIYLSLFYDNDSKTSDIKKAIVNNFEEENTEKGKINKVVAFLKLILTRHTIDFYRKADINNKYKTDKDEYIQAEIPAAMTRGKIGDEGDAETDAISQAVSGFDYGENKVNDWLEMIKKALLAHKRGEFEYKYSYTGLFLYAYYLTIGNVKKDGEQADTAPKLNDEILNTFNKILEKHGKNPVNPNTFLQIRNRFKEQDAQRIIDAFGSENQNMEMFGNDRSSTSSGDRDIAESKLRSIIRECILSYLKK